MVHRSLNLKVLAVTVLLAAGLAAGVYFLHDWQVGRTAQGLKRLAASQEAKSEWFKAAEYLDRYVRLQPTDAPASAQLALTYTRGAKLGSEKRRAAALHYRALGKSQAQHERELRASLAELLLDLGQFTEAETQARMLLTAPAAENAQPQQDDPRAWRALGLALAYQLLDGSLPSAKYKELKVLTTCERARRLNPADAKIAEVVATIYREWADVVLVEYPKLTTIERNVRADATMDQLVGDYPQDGKIALARYFYRVKHALDDAGSDLQQALRLAPDDAEVLLAAGARAFEDGQRLKHDAAAVEQAALSLRQAKDHFQRLVDTKKEEPLPAAYLGLGEAWLALGDTKQAIAAWRGGLKKFTAPAIKVGFHGRIADVLLEGDDFGQAEESLNEIDALSRQLGAQITREFKLAVSRELQLRTATLHYRRGELAAAVPLLRSVIVRQPQGDARVETTVRAWMLLATVQYSLGDWVEAATAFDQAASLQPSSQPARLVAARAYLMAGRPGLAAERAEEALAISSNLDAWLTLASAQFQLQVLQPPANRQWQRFEQALATLENAKMQLADSQPWRIDFLRVDYVMAQAAPGAASTAPAVEAARLLRDAEAAYAAEPAFWLQLCIAYENLGLAADADRALNECRQQKGAPTAIVLTAARLASLRKDYAGARKLLEGASPSAAVQDRLLLQNELLRVALAAKDVATVRNILTEQHHRQPTDLVVIRRLAELELEQGRASAAETWEQEAEKGGLPGQTLARYLRAARLFAAAKGNDPEVLKQALRELEQVVLARPNWAEAAALKGMTSHRLGRAAEAARDLERAVELGDRRVMVYELLVGLLDQLHRSSDVDRYLSRLAAELPATQRLSELASVQELRRENPAQAVEIARQGVEKRPSDPLAHLWLGRMALISGDLAQAEKSFEQALTLAESDPRVWNAMVSLSARTGDELKTRRLLTRLTAAAGMEPAQKSLLLAQFHELLGERDSAKSQYAAAGSQAPENAATLLRAAQFYLKTDVLEAERLLRQAMQLEPDSLAAKRMLAVALAAQGESKLEEAQRLLSDAKAGDTASVEDQRLRALLLAQQGDAAHVERAVKIFEGIIASSPSPAASDRQLLAQLYQRQMQLLDDPKLAQAKFDAAREQMEQALAGSSARPATTAAMIQFYARNGKQAEALAYLDRLEAAAASAVKPPADLLALVVQMQLQTRQQERCEKWLGQLAQAEPASLRPAALRAQVAVARDPRADVESIVEAKAIEVAAAASNPADQKKLLAGVGELYSSLNQTALAERWYRKLVAVAPDQYPLLVGALAKQGRLADAITLCEQAAKTDTSSRPILVMVAALTDSTPGEQDFKQAEPLLTAALKRFDKDAGLLYSATLVRIAEGRYDEAAELYRQVLAINPKFVPALNNLAMLLAERPAARNEAITLIDRAIEIAGKDAGLLDTKGAILTYSSRSAEALPLLVAATRGTAADPRHHFHLAVAYRDQGKLDEAKFQLKTALDRQLSQQVLMPTDQRLLAELRAALAL